MLTIGIIIWIGVIILVIAIYNFVSELGIFDDSILKKDQDDKQLKAFLYLLFIWPIIIAVGILVFIFKFLLYTLPKYIGKKIKKLIKKN